MDQSQENFEKIKKAQRTLWVSIFAIVLVGLIIAIYFIYLQPAVDDVDNINTINNTNSTAVNVNTLTNVSKSETLVYEDLISGYSVNYPDTYLIKSQQTGYVIFDVASIDSATNSYLAIIINVEDNDFHTYRLGLLTNSAVQSDTVVEEDVVINNIDGVKITYKDALGTTKIHYIFQYLGKVYDILAGDSVDQALLSNLLDSFSITAQGESADVTDIRVYTDKTCVSNNDCGAYPCYQGTCLVKECTSDSECQAGTCGQYVTPVPGYCTTIDAL